MNKELMKLLEPVESVPIGKNVIFEFLFFVIEHFYNLLIWKYRR